MTLPKRSYMKVTGLALACSSLLFSCAPKEVPQVNLIPKPAHIEVTGDYFKVDSNLVFGNDQSGTIRYVVDESFNGGNPEGYALNVTKKGIESPLNPDCFTGNKRCASCIRRKGFLAYRSKTIPVSRIVACIWMSPVISSRKRR